MIQRGLRQVLKHQYGYNKMIMRGYGAKGTTEEQTVKQKLKFAILLSGFGRGDGSDVIEAVSMAAALKAEKEADVAVTFFSADVELDAVFDPVKDTYDPKFERRAHAEAARISRGNMKNVSNMNVAEYDGLLMTSGKGYTRTFSTIDMDEYDFIEVLEDVERVIQQFHTQGKWIVALGHSNALTGYVLRNAKHPPTISAAEEKYLELLEVSGVDVKNVPKIEDPQNKLITSNVTYQDNSDLYATYEHVNNMVETLTKHVKEAL